MTENSKYVRFDWAENPENFNIYAADMNSDGKVTVTDVLLMYGLIP